jgi:dTDP-4-amino-4,6-dideoxygalactose transaminase
MSAQALEHRATRVGPPAIAESGASARRHAYLPFGKPDFTEAEVEAVARVIRSGWIGMGAETIAFEEELAAAFGAPHVVTVNSCTSALFLSLLVLGVGPGDEVVVPSLTWISTANAVRHLGATPVFCDVDRDTFCAGPSTIRACLTPRTKAVVVVHLGGLAVDVEAVRRAVPAHIAIVEDAAHACGATLAGGGPVGSSGNLTCFSFYANKNLSTGEGGAIALGDSSLAARLQSLRQHALPSDAWKRFVDPRSLGAGAVADLGYKMNYTDLQAALGRVQLRRQPELAARRLAVATIYAEAIASLPWRIALQPGVTGGAHARHLFLVVLPTERIGRSRDDILIALRERNIGASIHYRPVHAMELYAKHARPSLPTTDDLARRILTLPISASMSTDDARDVMSALDEVLARPAIGRARSGRRG